VPSESSSGERRRQGSITKAGNSHARRLLVEAAWQQQRRWRSFDARGKRSTVAAVAVARELAGWCWSLVTMDA